MPTTPGAHLPRLLQLVSPSLPIGAYSYSQGLEWAVEAGWVSDPVSLGDWVADLMNGNLRYWDLPLLARLYRAATDDDHEALARWAALSIAGRETAELRSEEHNKGRALASLLDKLGSLDADAPRATLASCQLAGYAWAAERWRIPLTDALSGYAWSWLENGILAGVKLIPLGQTDGQTLLLRLGDRVNTTVAAALALDDDDLGCSAPALAIASAAHEDQTTRLFRS